MSYFLCYVYALVGGVVGLFVASLLTIGMSSGTVTEFFMKQHIWIALATLVVLIAVTIIFRQFFSQHQTELMLLGIGTGIVLAYPLWIVLVVYILF